MHQIIALWTHPRSRSTAFERAMMERGDLEVLHEPFSYLYYVGGQGATIRQEHVDPEHPTSYAGIRAHVLAAAERSPVFFKDMCAHCCEPLEPDETFLMRLTHAFLVRDPKRSIPSFHHLNPEVTLEEIGYVQLSRIFDRVARLNGRPPAVINAEDLVADPEGICAAFCRAVGLPQMPGTTRWRAGHRAEWDVWKTWHASVAESTGITRRSTDYAVGVDDSPRLRSYYAYHMPFYRAVNRHRIQPVPPARLPPRR